MSATIDRLSSFDSPTLSSNLFGISFKQFKRTYPGNYSINFALCLSASNGFKTKNFTNFYLTNTYKFSDVVDVQNDVLKSNSIYTPIKFGSDFLTFTQVNKNYGSCEFTSTESKFTIVLLDDNVCNIYYTKNFINYYLAVDSTNTPYFVKKKLLSFDSSNVNPQDFKYLFSETDNMLFLFKKTETQDLFLTRDINSLVLVEVVDDNISSYKSKPFSISRNIYSYPNISLDMSFITYNNDNTINIDKSEMHLKNNLLLHKTDNYTSLIVLKNQLVQDDVFTCSNNLLSGNTLAVDALRDYTSISEDIKEETSDDIELNYVFYNKAYVIKPGSNEFLSPSSMYPFEKLNINDTKFIKSGAFAYTSPQYADKVFHLSNDIQNYDNGQYLLCTWLSGSPLSEDKVWVDRYYYPNLIDKMDALAGKPEFSPTYDNLIEQMIRNNASLSASIQIQKFFDKISDLAFEPDQKYRYERVKTEDLSVSSLLNSLSSKSIDGTVINYFKEINNSGKFTFGFYFNALDGDWIVKSDYNAIESRLQIEKSGSDLTVSYKLFDQSTDISLVPSLNFEKTVKLKDLKENFVCVTFDSITGKGYFYLNNEIIYTITIDPYQFSTKQLIYGDFFIIENGNKQSVLTSQTIIQPFILKDFITPDLIFSLPIINDRVNIDDITISLPCGMRNSADNLEYLQNVCGSSMFKSNNINIRIKNLNIDNESILTGIENSITTAINTVLPANTQISTITFENYR